MNANPDIAPDAGFARIAAVAGIEYPALVRAMCELGLQRDRERISVEDGWAMAQRLSGIATTSARSASSFDFFGAEAPQATEQAVGDH